MSSRPVKLTVLVTAAFTLAIYGGSVALSLTRDAPDTFDSDAVRARAAAACTALRSGIDALPALPPSADLTQRTDRVAEQERLVSRLVDDVRALGPQVLDRDVPAQQWLGDWATLGAARQAYVRTGGTGPFAVPLGNGRPIPERMAAVGVPACQVPAALVAAP